MSVAISKSNEKTKQILNKEPSKTVTTADAIDYLIDTFKRKNRPDKSVVKRHLCSKQKVKKHSLKSDVKRGIRALGEISEEIGKMPNVKNIKKQQEADLRSLKSANQHIKRDIAITAVGNKKGMTARSLTTKKSIRLYTNIGHNMNKRHRRCQQKNIPLIFT